MIFKKQTWTRAQAPLEYLLLLTVVAVVTFVAIKPSTTNPSVLNRAQKASEDYYKKVAQVIAGKNPTPINGGLCAPKPDGQRECACPAPAFGGKPCYALNTNLNFCGDGECTLGVETGKPGNPGGLQTCYEDCPMEPDCSKCGDMLPSANCGGNCPNAANQCEVSQACMTSNCPPVCGDSFKQFCKTDPLLCPVDCQCPGVPSSAGACGGPGIMCGPHPLGIGQKCFKYDIAKCNGTCTDYQIYVVKDDPTCGTCNDNIKNDTEIATDCGGSCRPCCGNNRIDNTAGMPADMREACDNGSLNGTMGNNCLSTCTLATNCAVVDISACPFGNVIPGECCGSVTRGTDSTFNPPKKCIIPKQCSTGETEGNCPGDCSACIANGNCIPQNGNYTCGGTTTGVYENCPTIPCTIPQRCDPTESCVTCPQDCDRGTCVADGAYKCDGPTTAAHYSNCPAVACGPIPKRCDSPQETCVTCAPDCGVCRCTGNPPQIETICPAANTNVNDVLPWVSVNACTGAKCEFRPCLPGYVEVTLRNNEKYCVCDPVDPNCAGHCNDLPSVVVPTACGPVTIPPTLEGKDTLVACPSGCKGSILASCRGGSYTFGPNSIHGGCAATTACPALAVSGSTLTNYLQPIDCGTTTFPATPGGMEGIAPCGPYCTGYIRRDCLVNGTWDNIWSQGEEGCVAAELTPCPARWYPPTEPQLICGTHVRIPDVNSGQTISIPCPTFTCSSGTITVSCSNGQETISNDCQ